MAADQRRHEAEDDFMEFQAYLDLMLSKEGDASLAEDTGDTVRRGTNPSTTNRRNNQNAKRHNQPESLARIIPRLFDDTERWRARGYHCSLPLVGANRCW